MNLYLPTSLRSITTTVGSFIDEAEIQGIDWAKRYKLVTTDQSLTRLAAMRPGALAAHCFPTARAPEMCLLANWMSWLFVIDDDNDEARAGRCPAEFEETLATVHEIAFGPARATTQDPLANALDDIWNRVRPKMSQAWQRRFVRHVGNYFSANVWQAAHRALDQTPTLDTFSHMRRDAGAIWPSFDLIEWVAGASLPPALYLSATYQKLLTTAADVVCWTNDIMTLDKELAQGDVHNLVLVLQHHRGGTLQTAIDEVVQRVDRRTREFLSAELDMPAVLDRLLLCSGERERAFGCVAMLRAWMRGHVDWGVRTERYWCGEEIWSKPHDGLPAQARAS